MKPAEGIRLMDHVDSILVLLLALLFAVAAVAGLARRFAISYPIALVIFGLLCSLLPHVPRIPLPPSLVFLVILPPLLYIAAWQTSWREFKYNLVSITGLAVFLVFFTAIGRQRIVSGTDGHSHSEIACVGHARACVSGRLAMKWGVGTTRPC